MLIVLYTVQADHLSFYGYSRNTTANLNTLAEESTVYVLTLSPGDLTLTSYRFIFTGIYARETSAHYDSLREGCSTSAARIHDYRRDPSFRWIQDRPHRKHRGVFFKDFGLEQATDFLSVGPSDEFALYKSLGLVAPIYLPKTIHIFLIRETRTLDVATKPFNVSALLDMFTISN